MNILSFHHRAGDRGQDGERDERRLYVEEDQQQQGGA